MNYKEKYNKLVEAVKKLQEANPSDEDFQNWVNDNVPELKWNDDEKIRKELIAFLRSYDTFLTQRFIDWLEKQGTQPRYNIGDILCDKLCTTLNKDAQPNMEIVDIQNGMYICDKGSFPVSQQDEYELVGKKIDTKLNDDSVSNELRTASFAHAEREMKNQTFPDNLEFELIYTFEEGAKWQATQRSSWSEKYIADVFEKVGLAKIAREQSNDALTIALQDAMIELSKVTLQPKPTSWSKDDDDNLGMIESRLIDLLSYTRKDNSLTKHRKNTIEEEVVGYVNWLTSLKARFTWKPSDEQMKELNYAVNAMASSRFVRENACCYNVLKSLHEQLMKLK